MTRLEAFNRPAANTPSHPDFATLAARLGVKNYSDSAYAPAELAALFPDGFANTLLRSIAHSVGEKDLASLGLVEDCNLERDCRIVHHNRESGLIAVYEVQLGAHSVNLCTTVSMAMMADDGQAETACSQFDLCRNFTLFCEDGIKAATPPQIFGVMSHDYDLWNNYYVRTYPERVIPHNKFVLTLARAVAANAPWMNAAMFHHLKDWAFQGFGQRMPGMTGLFHAVCGMDAQTSGAAQTFLATLPTLARPCPGR